MANGKFSQPRPDREEERQIEKAFRQLTGQEAPEDPFHQVPAASQTDATMVLPELPEMPAAPAASPEDFDIVFDEAALAEELPLSPEPEPSDAGNRKAPSWLEQALLFFETNRKFALIGLCAAALVLIVSFMGIFFLTTSDPYDNTILNNVIIADINVGGMTKEEAVAALQNATSHTYSALDMVVNLAGKEIRLKPADTGVSLDVKAAVKAAYDYGRTGTKAEQEQAYLNSLTGKHIIGLLPYLELKESYIRGVLAEYGENTDSTLTQASYGLDGGLPDVTVTGFDPDKTPLPALVITMGTPGIRFDADAVYDQILDAYSLHQFLVTVEGLDTATEPDAVDLAAIYNEYYIAPANATIDLRNYKVTPGTYGCGFDMAEAQKTLAHADYGETVRIPLAYIAPAVLNEDMFFQDVLASYETSYKDRGSIQTNLILACEAINGTVLNPGETFSFNTIVGKRTSEKGYKWADDQIGIEPDRILGGGISQVTSALYYCTLVADLNVISRTNHSLIPGFSDYGLDAAIGWDSPDFKFSNSLGLPIRIEASAEGGTVKITILGTDEADYFVAMDYEIAGTRAFQTEYEDYKHDNKEGYQDGDIIREGVPGYFIKTYRMKYDDKTGELISRDYVNTTQYLAVSKIVARVEEPETTEPTVEETKPTEKPTKPTEKPTKPTEAPTEKPTEKPTEAPTEKPTEKPTEAPTEKPTEKPTEAPTEQPTEPPTEAPTEPLAEKPSEKATEPAAESPAETAVSDPEPTVTEAPAETTEAATAPEA